MTEERKVIGVKEFGTVSLSKRRGRDDAYLVRIPSLSPSKRFTISQFSSQELCRAAAEQYLKENCKKEFIYESTLTNEEKQYAAGLIDGDGCILGSDQTFRIMFTQASNSGPPPVIQWLKTRYAGLVRLKKKRTDTTRDVYVIIWNGTKAIPLLHDLSIHAVIKQNQAIWALTFLKHYFHMPCSEPYISREELNKKLKAAKGIGYENVFVSNTDTRITAAYVAGFFDAEGCVHAGKRSTIEVSLCQRYCTTIITAVNYKFGTKVDTKGVSSRKGVNEKCMHLSGINATNFLLIIKPFAIAKKDQITNALQLQKFCKVNYRHRDETDAQQISDLQSAIKRAKYC